MYQARTIDQHVKIPVSIIVGVPTIPAWDLDIKGLNPQKGKVVRCPWSFNMKLCRMIDHPRFIIRKKFLAAEWRWAPR